MTRREVTFEKRAHPKFVPRKGESTVYLVDDNWDDFGFRTTFVATVFDEAGNKHEIGAVKIGKFGQGDQGGNTEIPELFSQLKDEFFSLGQDVEYYNGLKSLSDNLRTRILTGLRDIAADPALWVQALSEPVTSKSLLRFVTRKTVEGQYRRLVTGGDKLVEFRSRFSTMLAGSEDSSSVDLSFDVTPKSLPPTNLHVLVGRNGVGKTSVLRQMADALVMSSQDAQSQATWRFSKTSEEDSFSFANVVSVSFSAFDDFAATDRDESGSDIRYSYIGLRKLESSTHDPNPPKNTQDLSTEFANSLLACLQLDVRAARWRKAISTLESDPVFERTAVSSLHRSEQLHASRSNGESELIEAAKNTFSSLSSGHRLVLLTITRLVELTTERSLILLDEPENHLHPPLLSAFVRSLSDLLVDRNGVAIVATHSPVVLQEVPKSCVWILDRFGHRAKVERPAIETFGENLSVLTRQVFGYEVTNSGFHRMLRDTLAEGLNFDDLVKRFGNQLGGEARAIARSLALLVDCNG